MHCINLFALLAGSALALEPPKLLNRRTFTLGTGALLLPRRPPAALAADTDRVVPAGAAPN